MDRIDDYSKSGKLKILQVISTPPFAWATGGCARVVYDFSKELARKGHDVTILTTDLYKPDQRYPKKSEIIDGVKIIRFKYISNILAWKYKFYFSIGMINYLRKHLKEYDIIHLQDFISPQAYFTSKYCKKYGVPYVITTHGSSYWVLQKNILNQFYLKFVAKNILKYSNKIIALTKMELEHFKELGINIDKVKVIPNGIDLSPYNDFSIKGNFRRKNGLENDKIILYLGRINKIKGIDLLLKAFYKLIKEINNVKLIIVGPDEGYLFELKNLAKELNIDNLVMFTGPLYDEKKLEAYLDADVYVLPSNFETFPITVLEAWACETPVIVTNNCGIANHVKKAGIVVNDETQLKNAILKILIDTEYSKELIKQEKEIVTEFSWDNVSKKILNLYYGVLFNENHNNLYK